MHILCSCAKYRTMTFSLTITDPCQGRIQEFRKGGSKIKFMKGVGAGGGVPPPMAGPGAQPQPQFLVSYLFGMKIKALFTMIIFLNNLILTASSITIGLATLKKG